MEAKSLLKNFRKNEKYAVSRCNTILGNRSDLSLMNIQYVIAKECGFNNWNELSNAEDWQMVEALIKLKNKNFISPMFTPQRQTTTDVKKLKKPDAFGFNMESFTDQFGYHLLNFEDLDVSDYDLSELNILNVQYSEKTKWPEDKNKMPVNFNPIEFLEYRKNPGLGIRLLHKQNIDGRGRNVAIIDSFKLTDHLEYHNQLKGYEEIHINENNNHIGIHSSLVSSLVGKTCGVAPKANLYYYAVDNTNRSQIYYAEAIRKVCTLHKQLVCEGQNGFDAILILRSLSFEGFKDEEGYSDVIQAAQEATKLGIWCRIGPIHFEEYKLWREDRIYCKFGGDVDNPDDFLLNENSALNRVPLSNENVFHNSLNFPGGAWSLAQNMSIKSYVFNNCSGAFSASYMIGLYILAKSIYSDLTPKEYLRLGLETGDFRQGIGTIINPQRLINTLKNYSL